MSDDDDSGVDSGHDSNEPVLLAHRAINPDVNVAPVNQPQEMDHQSVVIQIEAPEMDSSSSSSNAGLPVRPDDFSPSDTTANQLPVDPSVMLCQDNCQWPLHGNEAAASTSNSEQESSSSPPEPEAMNFQSTNAEHCSPISAPSTSDSAVRVLGIKLRIDEDTMSNLHSFYQNSIAQHDLCPKIMKNRKHRVGHYEHLIAEKQLRAAANSNDYAAVCRLLETGVNVNAYDERKRTALHFAACHGNFGIAYALLDYGANPNQQDVIGNTPLHLAVCSSKLDIVILLLKNGANCNASDNTGRTPLQLAKSKLSLMSKNSKTLPTVNLKLESTKISIMLGIYFDKLHSDEKKAEIDVFKERLETRETNEEIEKDVNDLLKCLDEWTIN